LKFFFSTPILIPHPSSFSVWQFFPRSVGDMFSQRQLVDVPRGWALESCVMALFPPLCPLPLGAFVCRFFSLHPLVCCSGYAPIDRPDPFAYLGLADEEVLTPPHLPYLSLMIRDPFIQQLSSFSSEEMFVSTLLQGSPSIGRPQRRY